MLAHRLAAVALEGGIGTHGEPLLDLVFGVDLCGKPLVVVFLAAYYTVIVIIGYGDVVVAAVIAALHAHRVLLGPACSEHDVCPVGVGLAVVAVFVDEVLIGEVAGLFLPLDVLGSIHHLSFPSE